jgi:hypothetical protein
MPTRQARPHSRIAKRALSPEALAGLDVMASVLNRPVMHFGGEQRHTAQCDQQPHCKPSVPKESVDHECDSSLETTLDQYRPIAGLVDPGSARGLTFVQEPIPVFVLRFHDVAFVFVEFGYA